MAWVSVYLGLGSNQGDRAEALREAVRRLDIALGTRHSALSRFFETKSWGFDGPDFLNACVRYRLVRRGSPADHGMEILRVCKEIEREMGRRGEPRYSASGERLYQDRPIDIDILYYGTEIIDTELLKVPHPLIGEREFVKMPLREIAKPPLKAAFPDIFA